MRSRLLLSKIIDFDVIQENRRSIQRTIWRFVCPGLSARLTVRLRIKSVRRGLNPGCGIERKREARAIVSVYGAVDGFPYPRY
jgi:hypothetical protein